MKVYSQSNSTLSAQCPICSSSTSSILTTKLRRSDGTVFYCDSCNHGFLSEISVTSFQDYYSNSYRQEYSHKSDVNSTNPAEIYNVYHQYQAQRLTHILPSFQVIVPCLKLVLLPDSFLHT